MYFSNSAYDFVYIGDGRQPPGGQDSHAVHGAGPVYGEPAPRGLRQPRHRHPRLQGAQHPPRQDLQVL